MRWLRREPEQVQPEDVEAFFDNLPKMAHGMRFLARAALFVVVFTVAGVLLLSYRTEVQQDQIKDAARHDRATAFEQCQLVNANARALNGLIDTVISRVRSSALPDDEKADAVRLYSSSKQALPVCEQP